MFYSLGGGRERERRSEEKGREIEAKKLTSNRAAASENWRTNGREATTTAAHWPELKAASWLPSLSQEDHTYISLNNFHRRGARGGHFQTELLLSVDGVGQKGSQGPSSRPSQPTASLGLARGPIQRNPREREREEKTQECARRRRRRRSQTL